MEYIEELEKQLDIIKLDKLTHVKANNWEKAAACRDIEVYLQGKIKEAKEKTNKQ